MKSKELTHIIAASRDKHVSNEELGMQFRLHEPVITGQWNLLEEEGEIDKLTKLYVRTPFFKHLDEHSKISIDHDGENSIIVIDVDDFKKYNDTYGHQQGDKALEKLADVMSSSVRPSDKVARYGGEEFAISLPQTGLEDAFKMAERIRLRIEQTTISPNENRIFNDMGYEHRTVSLGVATYNFGLDDFLRNGFMKSQAQNLTSEKAEFDPTSAFFDCGDIALYHAKEGGKNRVVKYVTGMTMPDRK